MASIKIGLRQNGPTSVKTTLDLPEVIVDRPVEKGGGGTGLMGGQYLLIGVGGCFCSNFFAAAQARGVEVDGFEVAVVAEVAQDAPARFTKISLEASVKSCSAPEEFEKLLRIAEKGCISVNTMKHGLDLNVNNAN